MSRKLFALTAMGALALLLSGPGNQAEAGLFSKLFGGHQSNSCCEPVCCEPVCFAPAPVCCAPAPTCCAPAPTCCGDEAPASNGSEAAPPPAPPADEPPESEA